MELLQQDLRFAYRLWKRAPVFTAVAVLTLAMGIGANTAVFSLLHALLWRPLPFAEPDRLVWINNPATQAEGIPGLVGQATFRDWRERSQSFAGLAAYLPTISERSTFMLAAKGGPVPLRGGCVSVNLLDLLGVRPQLGRGFVEEESQRNGAPVLMLSDGCWRRQFGADAGIVGRFLHISGAAWRVVGVLPRPFDFSATFAGRAEEIDFLFPFKPVPGYDNWGNLMAVVGRLKARISPQQAQIELGVLNAQLRAAHPERGDFGAGLSGLREHVSGGYRRSFLLLGAAVGAVLVIACVNLANLLLARGAGRRQELSVRLALGAGRWRLIRQLLSESMLLALAGAVLAVPLAYLATAAVARTQAWRVPLLENARVDLAALGVTGLAAVGAGLLFGTLPALVLSASGGNSGWKDAGPNSTHGPRRNKARGMLIIGEVGLTYGLLVCSGLLISSLVRLIEVDPGFQPEHRIAFRLQTQRQFENTTAAVSFYRDLRHRVEAIPGVQAVTLPDNLPLDLNDLVKAHPDGVVYRTGGAPSIFAQTADENYFRTLGIPLRAGRTFDAHDVPFDWDKPVENPVVVNQIMAAQFWPGKQAIGQSVVLESAPNARAQCRVIGVVGTVRQTALDQQGGPEVYLAGSGRGIIVLRTRQGLATIVPLVRATLREIDPGMVLVETHPLAQILDRAVSPKRGVAWLLGSFATVALVLAAIGIYGVTAYTISQRSKEIGIRLALGSSPARVMGLLIGQSMRVILVGCALGLLGSIALTRSLRALLFGVSPTDPLILGATGLLVLGTALLASWLPARRVSKVDPLPALRCD